MIGEGAFGCVYYASKKKTIKKTKHYKYVVKFTMVDRTCKMLYCSSLKRFIPSEAWILARLRHPNLPTLADFYEETGVMKIVMNWSGLEKRDLFNCLIHRRFSEADIANIFNQLASAISYLHRNLIAHRDIKAENIIMDPLKNVTLIDFGAASFVRGPAVDLSYKGTVQYRSPEIILCRSYDPLLYIHQDIWAIGCTLYMTLFFKQPFENEQDILKGKYKLPRVRKHSKALVFLLKKLLKVDRFQRITVCEIEQQLQHLWILSDSRENLHQVQ